MMTKFSADSIIADQKAKAIAILQWMIDIIIISMWFVVYLFVCVFVHVCVCVCGGGGGGGGGGGSVVQAIIATFVTFVPTSYPGHLFLAL